MKNFIRLELKKSLNRTTLVISSLLIIIILIHLIIIQGVIPNSWTKGTYVLDEDGKLHSGFGVYRILKARNAGIEGYVTPEYLTELRGLVPLEKKYILGEARSMKDFGEEITYPFVSLFTVLNRPYGGPATQEVGYLWEEEEDELFYENWKASYPGNLIYKPVDNFGFTDRQLEILSERMRNIET
ncbi:MAG TPA: hypothetical protein VN441_01350, partial [Syntrophomonas sp.]|nr:hypothetical protein [Syntrophomonas sp.]